jgi:hypothetical protein
MYVYRVLNSTINISWDIIWLNKIYKEWENARVTISAVEVEAIELPTGIDDIKSTTNATKDTEEERNKLNNNLLGQ